MGIPVIQPYPMPRHDELPANVAHWTLAPDRTVLLIHDMQRYFLQPFPPGSTPVVELIRNIRRLRELCDELGIPIAYTAQPGGMTDSERGLLKDFWGPGMAVSAEHRTVVDGLTPRDQDFMLTKWRYSAFHRSDLREFLNRAGRDQLVICGVYAHVGCLITACDAFSLDIQPFLVADAVADFSADYHRMALSYAAERCAMTPTTEAVLTALQVQDKSASSLQLREPGQFDSRRDTQPAVHHPQVVVDGVR